MRKAISFFLSLSLIVVAAASAFDSKISSSAQQTAGQVALLSDDASENLVGQGPSTKKFVNGVMCGAGAVILVAGFASGFFTGGLGAIIVGAAFAGQTASSCADAF